MPSCYSISDDSLLCPRPRRLPFFYSTSNYQSEFCDSRFEILDMIFTKGNNNSEQTTYEVPCSPPFFMGSPPCRASNPVIQDAQFGIHNLNLYSPTIEFSTSSQHNNGGCPQMKYKQKSAAAAVRIEGFNCGNCSISDAVL